MGKSRSSSLYRLLENYVLDAIGELPEAEAAETARVVRAVFKTRQDWRAVMTEQFGFAPGLAEQLEALWREGRRVAQAQGAELTPRAFASMVVDENFSDTLEMLATEFAKRYEKLEDVD